MEEVAIAAACVVFDSASALEGAVSCWVVDSLEISINSEPLSSGLVGRGCIVWSLKALTWSMWRFHTCPSSVVMEKVTGPNCFVAVPGIHVSPGHKFLTITFSPIDN